LRQVDGAEAPEGGWVGGDAWFGSMMSVVETRRLQKARSMFIAKNNQAFCPMRPLRAVPIARFGNRPAGHWVVFQLQQSADHIEGCNGMHAPGAAFPKEQQVNVHPGRSTRWRRVFSMAI
jgi:hypothetical protein